MHKVVLITINQHRNFEVSSFIRSNIWMGTQNVGMGHVTMTTPITRMIYHRQPGLAIINLCTKFEVSRCTRWGDIKGEICRQWGGLEWLGYPRPNFYRVTVYAMRPIVADAPRSVTWSTWCWVIWPWWPRWRRPPSWKSNHRNGDISATGWPICREAHGGEHVARNVRRAKPTGARGPNISGRVIARKL